MTVETVPPDELEVVESTPGIERRPVFRTANNTMVMATVAADTATGWHHHADRHAYGYILEGRGAIEYADDGTERLDMEAPLFFQIPPGTVHREITDTEMTVVVSFVGNGPVAVNVAGPGGE